MTQNKEQESILETKVSPKENENNQIPRSNLNTQCMNNKKIVTLTEESSKENLATEKTRKPNQEMTIIEAKKNHENIQKPNTFRERSQEEIQLAEAILNYKNMVRRRESNPDLKPICQQKKEDSLVEALRPLYSTPNKTKPGQDTTKIKEKNSPGKKPDLQLVMSAVTVGLTPFGKLYETINDTLKDHTSILASVNSKLTHLEGYILALESWKNSTRNQGTQTDKIDQEKNVVFQFKNKLVTNSTQTILTETSKIKNGKEPHETLEKRAERPTQKDNKDKPKRDIREPTSIKKHLNLRDQLNETESLTNSERKADHSKAPQELEKFNKQAQKKAEKTTKPNELLTKWITVTDKKPSMKENSNIQTNPKGEANEELNESTIDISNISTYSIENSESEIPRSMAKKRKVSFVENESTAEKRRENQYKKQTKNPELKRENLEDSEYTKDRISPERKTLFRLSKRKLNKYDHRQRSNEEAHPKSGKRMFENERQEIKAKRSDIQHQQTYLTPIRQKGKASERRTRRSPVIETDNNRRRDTFTDKRNRSNQRSLDRSLQQNRIRNSTIFSRKSNSTRTLKLEKRSSSEEKTILNRRTLLKLLDKFTNGDLIKSIDINIVEFAHKGRTDSIFLHIMSQTVKKLLLQMTKDFSNQGYLLRETTPEEKGQKIQKTNEIKQKYSYEDTTRETDDWINNTPNRKYNLKEKRKYLLSPRNYEHMKKVEREKNSKLKVSSVTEITKETRKEKSREDHYIKKYRNDDEGDTEKTKTRKINGPIRPQEGTGIGKNTTKETTSTQNRLDLAEKSSKRWTWLPQALTRYTGK
ncbi:uncharacterized protein PF3D7_1120000-like [Ambystoma mexicanum]|uniref:uncharacterized protein PF3D7_1120000-like n=1 Tax=Ambystoma mexicanum TaxID=8296 RepID=UPI0037E825BB